MSFFPINKFSTIGQILDLADLMDKHPNLYRKTHNDIVYENLEYCVKEIKQKDEKISNLKLKNKEMREKIDDFLKEIQQKDVKISNLKIKTMKCVKNLLFKVNNFRNIQDIFLNYKMILIN